MTDHHDDLTRRLARPCQRRLAAHRPRDAGVGGRARAATATPGASPHHVPGCRCRRGRGGHRGRRRSGRGSRRPAASRPPRATTARPPPPPSHDAHAVLAPVALVPDTDGNPPALVLAGVDGQVAASTGSYCWSGDVVNGVGAMGCADAAAPDESTLPDVGAVAPLRAVFPYPGQWYVDAPRHAGTDGCATYPVLVEPAPDGELLSRPAARRVLASGRTSSTPTAVTPPASGAGPCRSATACRSPG